MKLNIPLIAAAIAGAGILMALVYADPSAETVTVFRILMCACVVTIPSMLLGYPFLAALGHATYVNLVIVIVSVIHVTGIFILYYFGWLSIYTMAVMVIVSELLLFLLRLKAVVKHRLFQ